VSATPSPTRGWTVGIAQRVAFAAVSSFSLALVLRLLLLTERRGALGPLRAAALHLGAADPEYGSHVLDAAWYDSMARQILGLKAAMGGVGGAHLLDQPYSMAPLYGYMLAGIYAVFGADDPTPVYVVQAIAGGLVAALSAWLAAWLVSGLVAGPGGGGDATRRSKSWRPPSAPLAAWVAGLAVASYPVAIHYDVSLLGVTLSTLLTVVAVMALLAAWRPQASWLWALVGGLFLGLAVTARGNLLIVAPLLVLAALLRGWGSGRGWARAGVRAGLIALGLALPLGLSAAHNYSAGGELVLVSANGGINLYQGNNPYVVDVPVKTFRLPAGLDATAVASRLVASRNSGRWLSPAQADRYWLRRALHDWARDPVRAVGLFLRKLHQTLSAQERGDNTDLREIAVDSAVLSRLPWLYGPLAALGLLGLWVKGEGPRRACRARDLPARLVLVVGLCSVALFFVLSRYRLPLCPLLFAYAGVAVAWLCSQAQARRWWSLGGGLAATLALLALAWVNPLAPWLPWSWMADRGLQEPPPCLVHTHVLREPRIESEYRRAKAALLAGDFDTARQRLGAILIADPGHDPAAVDLSALMLQSGDLAAAAKLAEQVIDRDGCDDKAWSNLGAARLRQGRSGDAARAYRQAHQLDPYSPAYEFALGEALLQVGEEDRALALLRSAMKWGPTLWQPRAVLGQRALRAGDFKTAVSLLRPALDLAPGRLDLHAMLGLSLVGTGDLPGARVILADAEQRGMGRALPIQALRQAIDKVGSTLPSTLPALTP